MKTVMKYAALTAVLIAGCSYPVEISVFGQMALMAVIGVWCFKMDRKAAKK